jgi:predicted nuclease of predicted toxin-antitoxin system
MRFKVDENLHDDVAAFLAADGYDAHTVHVEGMSGGNDSALAAHCRKEDRVLITLDRDFADIRAYPPADYPGLIVLRLGNQSRPHVLNVMAHVVDLLKREPVAGRLWIVSEAGVRIRDG